MSDAPAGDAIGSFAGDGLVGEADLAAMDIGKTADRVQQGRLARTVRPDHGDDLALIEGQVDAF